jgi:hypothetical protein
MRGAIEAELIGAESQTTLNGRLIEQFMPQYDTREHHETLVQAPAGIVFEVAKTIDLQSNPLVRAIFWLRSVLMRSGRAPPQRPKGLVAETQALGWRILAERPGRELVMGAAAKPWKGDVQFQPIPPEEFRAFAKPDLVKIVWTLEAEPLGGGVTRFRTETRALATDRKARVKFMRYWRLVVAGITLIRLAMLPAVRHESKHRFEGKGTARRVPRF